MFEFMFERPEEIGEYWLVRRKDFDIRTWVCHGGWVRAGRVPGGRAAACALRTAAPRAILSPPTLDEWSLGSRGGG